MEKKVAMKKAQQIENYYIFHKIFEFIFNNSKNPLINNKQQNIIDKLFSPIKVNKKEKLFIIDKNWIKQWKKYSNYDIALNYFNKIKFENEQNFIKDVKEICQNLVLLGEINDNEENKPVVWDNESYGKIFVHKIILDIKDFDNIVNEKTFNLFKKLSGKSFFSRLKKTISLESFISDRMISLLIKKELKIKFIFHGGKNDNKNLIQLTADFNHTNGKKPFNVFNLSNPLEQKYGKFIFDYLLKSNSDDLINFFINKNNIDSNDNVNIYTETGEIYYVLKNDNIYKGELNENFKITNIKLENVNIPKIVGLANIGATCYMNAALQCLINLDALTRYLLYENIYLYIMENMNIFELTSCYKYLL